MEASRVPSARGIALPRPRRLLRALGDSALVERARTGDERAFEVIWDRHHAGILSFCRHMLGSREEAEDVVQHTFMSAHRALGSSEREIALKAWLYAIARNRCLSLLRARREQPADELGLSTAGLAEEVERRDELRDLLRDLAELPERQRAALVLAELGDLSHQEIGRVLDCEAPQVKSYVFQARSALIDTRKARETPCAEIREQLATASGGELRRRTLRRHLAMCEGCREFRDEVRSQRGMLAALLPVAPTLGLKEGLLAAIGLGGGGGGALAGGIAAGGAAKVAVVVVAVAGGAGGVALVEDGRDPARPAGAAPAPAVVAPPASSPAEGHGFLPAAIGTPAAGRTPASPGRRRSLARGRGPEEKRARPVRRGGPKKKNDHGGGRRVGANRDGARGKGGHPRQAAPRSRGREQATARGQGRKRGLVGRHAPRAGSSPAPVRERAQPKTGLAPAPAPKPGREPASGGKKLP